MLWLLWGCDCGSAHGASLDAGLFADGVAIDARRIQPTGPPAGAFVEVSPRDAALPCEGPVSVLGVATDDLPPAEVGYGRQTVHVAADGDGGSLVLGWMNSWNGERRWLAARVPDPSEPRAELIAELPLPGLVAMFPTPAGVRFVFTADPAGPRDGVTMGAWSDLGATGFGTVHPFELSAEGFVTGGVACTGRDAIAFAVQPGSGTASWFVMDISDSGTTSFPPVDDPEPCLSDEGVAVVGCEADGDRVTALVRRCGGDLGIAQWTDSGETFTDRAVVVDEASPPETSGMVFHDDRGIVVVTFEGGSFPLARAYAILDGGPAFVSQVALGSVGPADPTLKMVGSVASNDRTILFYEEAGLLSAVTFSREGGLASPVLIADYLSCDEGTRAGVRLGSGVYLACRFHLIRLCGGQR